MHPSPSQTFINFFLAMSNFLLDSSQPYVLIFLSLLHIIPSDVVNLLVALTKEHNLWDFQYFLPHWMGIWKVIDNNRSSFFQKMFDETAHLQITMNENPSLTQLDTTWAIYFYKKASIAIRNKSSEIFRYGSLQKLDQP